MSHPLYNPYGSGSQGSTQGQYGLSSMQDERDPRRASSHLGPGSIYSSSGASSVTPANSGGMIPSLLPQMMSSRSEQSRAIIDGNIERSVDMPICRSREEVRPLGTPIHQPIDQGTHFTNTQRDEFLSSGTGMASYPMSSTSASPGQRHSGVESGSSSLDWLLNYPRPTADDPSRFYSSSSSSNYASSEREHNMQSIPGLGDLDYPVPDKPAAPTQSSKTKYTSESAFDILLQFGLEKEDLEHLLCYPEDQITPANLPFILRKIRFEKTNKASTAVQSKPCPKPEPTRISGMDSHSLSSSGEVRMHQKEMSSAVFQPSKVIDYGHTSKYTGGVRDEIGRPSGSRANSGGSMLPMDTYDSRHSQEPLQTTTTEVKSSALGSSHDQGSSDSCLKSSYSSILSCVAPPSNDQTKQMQTQPNQMLQSILSSFFSPPNKDTDIRTLKSEVPKPVPLKEPVADHQSTSKTQPSSTLCRDVHPSRPGLMVIGSNVASGTKDQSKTPGQVSIVAEQMKKQQTQQQPPQMQADLQTGKTMWPSVHPAVKSNPPASPIPSIIGVMQHPGGPRPVIIPPAQPQPISKPRNLVHPMPPPSTWQSLAKVPDSRGQPTVAMMHDYAAATPRIFPHTCCLCNKECPYMEDWIIHQNTNLHVESCRHLRKQYPDWDGDITLRLSAAGKGDQPSSSLLTAQHLQKTRHGSSSCSRSPSPRHHHGSEGRQEKSISRSLSPLCYRYTRRSRSRSHSPWYDSPTSSRYRSRSRSAERRSPPRRRDEKWSSKRREDRRSSPRWSDERRSLSTRSDERLSPPKRSIERLSPPRRSDQRRSAPRRSDQRLSPPRRSDQRLSPPRRSDQRLSPPRRSDQRLSPPRRSNKRLSPPRRSDQRLSPPRRSNKRLSPPRRSDQRLSPPRRSDHRLSPPRRSDQRLSPPRRSDQRLSPSRRSDQRLSPSRRSDQRLSPPRRSNQRLSPPRWSDQRLLLPRRSDQRLSPPSRSDQRLSPPRRSDQRLSPPRRSDQRLSPPRRSDERLSPPRRSDERLSPPRRSDERLSPPRRSDERLSPPRRSDERLSPPRRSDQRLSPPRKRNKRQFPPRSSGERSPPRRSVENLSPPRRSDDRRLPPTRSEERRSPPRRSVPLRSPQRKKSSSTENLVKKLLKTSAVQSLSNQSDLEAVAKILAPAFLAELAKMESSSPSSSSSIGGKPSSSSTASSSSFSSTAKKKDLTKKPSKAKPNLPKREASCSTKLKETVSKKQKKLPHKKPATSSVSTPQTTATRKVLLPTPKMNPLKKLKTSSLPSGAKKAKTGKFTNQESAAKGSVTGPTTTIKGKVLVSKAKNVSDKQIAKMSKTDKLPVKGKAVVKQKASSGSKSRTPENQTDFISYLFNIAKIVEKAEEPKFQAELKSSEAKYAEPLEDGEIGDEVAEPMEVGSCAEGQEETPTTTDAVPENSADKSSESQPLNSAVDTQPKETSVSAVPHVQQRTLSEPESTAQGLETKTEVSHYQQQAAGSSTETAVEAKLPDGGVVTKTMHKDPVTAVKTQTDASEHDLTIGEMVEKHLPKSRIPCIIWNSYSFQQMNQYQKMLLITNLPEYHNSSYTEDDIAKLLKPFGFQHTDNSIYVVPQTCMAFVSMPTVTGMKRILAKQGIPFKRFELGFHTVALDISRMTPLGFYKTLMEWMDSPVDNDQSVVIVKNISWNETRELREALKKIDSVKNFLPLLNKVFIEFESMHDADRLGVWYSLLKRAPRYEVHRLIIPYIDCTLHPPRLPQNALPDSKDAVAGATVPPMRFGIPQGSFGLYWVTMRTRPFMFPTVSPWFIIPDHLTVRGLDDIERASERGSKFHTIMLTGLTVVNFKHEDVVKLVWRYFPKQNLQSLYYNVSVLTLQRRAFVFFADWTSCCDFVRDHIANPVSVKGCWLSVHFVLEQMCPESSEERMYTSLMKWSNAGVPDPKSLEERLLCVEISETSMDVIKVVMETVASIATFVSFLPLANRICIEMEDSSSVTKVYKNYNTSSAKYLKKAQAWSKVQRVESMKSLKQRLQDSSEITVKLGSGAIYVKAKRLAVKCQTQPLVSQLSDNGSQPALQTSGPGGSTISEPIAAGPSATASSDVAMKEEGDKSGTEVVMDSTVGPQANEDVEKAKDRSLTTLSSIADVTSSGNTIPAASSSAPSATAPEENFTELPRINTAIFQALKAAVRNHRLARESTSQSEDKKAPSKSNTISAGVEDTTQRKSHEDFTDDSISSSAFLFDDEEDMWPTPHRPSSSKKSRRKQHSLEARLTVGEMADHYMDLSKLKYNELGRAATSTPIQLFITNLPEYHDDCYTEDDLVKVLRPFGYQHTDNSIYIFPQTRMAFVTMPAVKTRFNIRREFKKRKVFVKGSRLHFQGINIPMTLTGFYKALMKLIRFPVKSDRIVNGDRSIVFIKNISWSETRELREALNKISGVRNFLPVLNKVFIHFESIYDADRIGVWYSLLKQAPGYEVHRLKPLTSYLFPRAPLHPENALPDSKDAVAEATVPPMEVDIPKGSFSPFRVTMKTSPFLFPTMSPWFSIPEFLTIENLDDIEVAGRGSMFPTVMLTGLPVEKYKHEDVAKLVWRYFPKQNLHSLYYNVVVLTLQRRAFVFFDDWTSCCDFVRDHIKDPVAVGSRWLIAHFVLDHMRLKYNEDMMYTTLMKWSNAGLPQQNSLEERLLCVKISETSLNIISVVMEMVKSIADFVNFLPLANRICIEMADSSGVKKVVDKYNTSSKDFLKKDVAWSKVQRVESVKSLKQRLQDPSEIEILDPIEVEAELVAVKCQTQFPASAMSDNVSEPALQTSGPGGSSISEPITAGPSDVAMEDSEKPGTEIAMDSTVGPEANEDVEKAEVKGKELPQINTDVFQVLKAALHNYRLTRGSRAQSEDKKSQDDVTDDKASSDSCLVDERNFNMDDLVTIDEVGDDMGDTNPGHHRSTSKHSSRARRKRQSSGVSSTGKWTSTRSFKDAKSTASSSSSSSKSNKGSSSYRSVSQNKSKNLSDTPKSTKSSATASVSKASYSSSPMSDETPSSPDLKTQQDKTESPVKASNTASSHCSTACEKESITSVATVKVPMETHSEPLREEAKDTKSIAAKTDSKLSAECIDAKTIETKIETSSETQGHEVQVSQAMSQAIDLNVNTVKDQTESKKNGKQDDADKHTKVEEDEKHQILDSLDDQTDEPMHDRDQDCRSEAQLIEPEQGQTLCGEIFQVLDSVNDDNGETEDQAATGQTDSHLPQDDSFTVKPLSEEDAISGGYKSYKDLADKDHETDDKDHFQSLHTGTKQAPTDNGDGKKRGKEDVKDKMCSAESCKASKDVENPGSQIPNENLPPPDPINKETLKHPASDFTERETFEILDSIDDQTVTEDDSQNLETPIDQISKEDIRPMEEEEDTYQVVDSVEDQPTTLEAEAETSNKGKRNTRREAISRKDNRPSKRSCPTTRASSEEKKSSRKQDKMVKNDETQSKMDSNAGVFKQHKEVAEEIVYEIVDSVEDESVQDAATTEESGRRRSARGSKEDKMALDIIDASERPEDTYEILDSVEDDTDNDESTITTKSTSGRRERTTKKDASNEKMKKGATSPRGRHTPARESQERNQEKTPRKEEKSPPKDSTPSKTSDNVVSEEDTMYEVIDSVEDVVVQDDQPTTRRKGKRGRPRKVVQTTIKQSARLKEEEKDTSEKVADEEEATYEILDSVEDDTVDDQPPTGQSKGKKIKNNDQQTKKSGFLARSPKKEEGEETMYQIIDSLEDDQVQEELTATGDKTIDETKEEPLTEKADASTCELRKRQASAKEKQGQTLCGEIFQVLDSVNDDNGVTEDQAATGQTDSHLLQDDSFTVKPLSEEDAISGGYRSYKDLAGKDHETDDKDNFQSLHTGTKQAPTDNGDGKKRGKEDVKDKMCSAESCKASKDVENPGSQIPNENQPPPDPTNKDTLKHPASDFTEQETFEILDSIDDQTVTEDDSQNLETPIDQISKEDIRPMEEEEDTYQVVDSVEDQPTTLEAEAETSNKGKRNTRREAISRKDDRPSKRSCPTTRASSEEKKSPRKQDKMVKNDETQTKMDSNAGVSKQHKEVAEEIVYEIVDSVEDESVQDAATTEESGRRSARGSKEDKMALDIIDASERPEDTYEILDSVEDDTDNDESTITTKSTSGRRERTTKKDASNEKMKKGATSPRGRHTPARESQERNQEKTPRKEEKSPPKDSTPSKTSDNVVSEEDTMYEVIDSVEDVVVQDDQPTTRRKGKRGRPRKVVQTTIKQSARLKEEEKDTSEKVADEEEATYEILDSVEDDTVDDQPPTGQSKGKNIKNNDQQTKKSGFLARSPKKEEEEEPMYQIIDSLEDDQVQEELTATGDKTIDETKEKPLTEKADASTCELRKRQASAKEKQFAKQQEVRRTRESEERERRSRSSSSSSSRGGRGRGRARWAKEGVREKKKMVAVDPKELVTLDEVGADEAGEERASESREWDQEITEGDLQSLVTLDEFVEEEEDGKAKQSMLETCPPSQEDESVDFLNPETLVTLDEAGDEEEKPHQAETVKTSRSAKHKHSDETVLEESMNFVTVDEVGEVKEEEEKEVVKTRTRGRAKKRTRQMPVRKSTRGEKVALKDEREEEREPAGTDAPPPTALDASSSLDKDPSMLSSDSQAEIQKTEVEAASRADIDASSVRQEQQLEQPENQTLDIKVLSKGRREPVRHEAKRTRSQAPGVAANVKLAFKPNTPLGQESVVSKLGYYCNLCCVFCLKESTGKDLHCSSQGHLENLQKHQQRQSRRSTQSSQSSISD